MKKMIWLISVLFSFSVFAKASLAKKFSLTCLQQRGEKNMVRVTFEEGSSVKKMNMEVFLSPSLSFNVDERMFSEGMAERETGLQFEVESFEKRSDYSLKDQSVIDKYFFFDGEYGKTTINSIEFEEALLKGESGELEFSATTEDASERTVFDCKKDR